MGACAGARRTGHRTFWSAASRTNRARASPPARRWRHAFIDPLAADRAAAADGGPRRGPRRRRGSRPRGGRGPRRRGELRPHQVRRLPFAFTSPARLKRARLVTPPNGRQAGAMWYAAVSTPGRVASPSGDVRRRRWTWPRTRPRRRPLWRAPSRGPKVTTPQRRRPQSRLPPRHSALPSLSARHRAYSGTRTRRRLLGRLVARGSRLSTAPLTATPSPGTSSGPGVAQSSMARAADGALEPWPTPCSPRPWCTSISRRRTWPKPTLNRARSGPQLHQTLRAHVAPSFEVGILRVRETRLGLSQSQP